MATEDKMTLTQINPDGSQSILEVTSKTLSPDEVHADPSLLEMIVDAIFDSGDDEHETYLVPTGYVEPISPFESMEIAQPMTWDSGMTPEFGAPMMPEPSASLLQPTDMGGIPSGPTDSPSTFADPIMAEQAWNAETTDSVEENPESEYAQAARDAQDAADDFISRGDYRAAQEAREQAEEAADLAGDQSMLSLYDAQDLGFAADKQELADQYRLEQADLIEKGDYEGAREAAWQSGYATRDADSVAGGEDHSGQASRDAANLDWSVWHEKNADADLFNADQAAKSGNLEQAEMYADHAGWQQSNADHYADQANPDSVQWNVDPSSTVESGGSYDAALNSIDTGFTPTIDDSSATDFSSDADDMTV